MNKSYLGKAGQLFLMSEFLIRGWNVAIPEVDTGTDVLMIQDDTHDVQPVQVKTSTAKLYKNNTFKAQFNIPLKQLEITAYTLQYAFVIRHENQWASGVIIIGHDELFGLYQKKILGKPNKKGTLLIQITFEELHNQLHKARIKDTDLTNFINAYKLNSTL